MEWRGEGMKGSDGGRGGVREGVVWCDAGLSYVEGGWSSVGAWSSFVMAGCRSWVGDGPSWWGDGPLWLGMVVCGGGRSVVVGDGRLW